MNPYLYANANPLRYVDPYGLQAEGVLILPGLGGAGAAGAGGAGATGAAGAGAAGVGAAVTVGAAVGVGIGLGVNKGVEWIFDAPVGVLIYEMCHENEGEREKRCDQQYYKTDIPVCRAIGRARGAAAAEACYRSASNRYATCLRGQPLPPLNTWNN